MRERDIEKILTEEVKREGGRAYKWTSQGNAGVPDRIVIFPNRKPIFVELKTEGGSLSPLQVVQIMRLRDLGQAVEVVYGVAGLRAFFASYGYVRAATRIAIKCKA